MKNFIGALRGGGPDWADQHDKYLGQKLLQQLRDGDKTVAGNLCLACPRCNANKGPNVAGVDPVTGRIVRLFHPRLHKWTAHFAWDSPVLVARAAIGRTTLHILAINDPRAVAVRQPLIDEGQFPKTGFE